MQMQKLWKMRDMTPTSKSRTVWLRWLLGFSMMMALLPAAACLEIKAPERINVNSGRPARVDPGRVPHISTVEEGRYELDKAYQNIRYLEDRVAKLERDKDEARRERDDYKDRNKRDRDRDDD